MDKKNLTIALEKAIEKMDKKGDKEVFNDLLKKLNRCSNVYIHYIEKSIIDAIGGGR